MLLEVTSDDAHITCVDPVPNCTIFNQLYKDFQHKIELHCTKSQNFVFGNYDLIIIDGDKNFASVSCDITNSINSLEDNGMLLINEYQKDDVARAVEELVLPAGLVPFLKTDQTLFFHRQGVDREKFLDVELSKDVYNFIQFINITCWGHVVLHASTLPIFSDRLDFFDLALKEFDI